MHELARESIDGTPGASASLTLVAVAAPAYPRMHQVAASGSMLHYTIESSTGQVLCTGVGVSTGAGAFTRLAEFSHWDGTTYTRSPGALASLPAACSIYLALSATTAAPVHGPACSIDADRWVLLGPDVPNVSGTPSLTASRDYYWRSLNCYPHKIDAIAIHSTGSASFDVGLYEVDWATGYPGKLLLGWQGKSVAGGMNTVTLASATLGSMSAVAQPLPLGDVYWALNVSAGGCGRTVPNVGRSGSSSSDMTAPKSILYRNRTNNTAFGDAPSITGRIIDAWSNVPMISARGS